VESTWENRDLIVLQAAVKLMDASNRPVLPEQLAAATDLPIEDVQHALRALGGEDPPYFQCIDGSSLAGASIAGVTSPTGHARRTVGAWPTPEGLTERIIDGLQTAVDQSTDEKERTRAQKALDGVKGVGKGVLTSVLVKVLTDGL
jgi:hypothetical protein